MFNKKIITGAVLISALTLQVGCAGGNEINSNNNGAVQQEKKENQTTTQDKIEQDPVMDEFDSLIEEDKRLDEVIAFVDKNISLLYEENASIMIDKLQTAQVENLPKLEERFYSNDLQSKMLEVYKTDFDINNIDNIDDKELKDLLLETRDHGYKVETAEGMFFPIINYEFYKQYSSYVTYDMKDYIDIMAVESNKVPAKDGALVIGWDEVLNRALNQERFINKYPDSVKLDSVKQLYKNYVSFTLFGLNNTPLFDYDSKVMVDDAKNVYMNAIENNERSKLVETLKGFLDLLQKDNYKLTDESDTYRKSAIEGTRGRDKGKGQGDR